MLAHDSCDTWTQFLIFVKTRCSPTAFGNWLEPIRILSFTAEEVTLEIPNIFVKEYLLSNYKQDLCAFLPVTPEGEPAIRFVIDTPVKSAAPAPIIKHLDTEKSPENAT